MSPAASLYRCWASLFFLGIHTAAELCTEGRRSADDVGRDDYAKGRVVGRVVDFVQRGREDDVLSSGLQCVWPQDHRLLAPEQELSSQNIGPDLLIGLCRTDNKMYI